MSTNSDKKPKRANFKVSLKSLLTILDSRKRSKRRIKHVTLTVVVLGHKSVGKTSLIKALCGCAFERDYTPTVLDVYKKECTLGSSHVTLEFIDLAGEYSFPAMTRLYIEKADVYLLVYDRAEVSYKTLERLKTEIEELRGRHVSELSVAAIKTKCDSNRKLKERKQDGRKYFTLVQEHVLLFSKKQKPTLLILKIT